MASLQSHFANDVRPWLKLAEDLRSLNLESELNVPQICVMGDQSSGKSSVLEALSGIPFPRGVGLVTRCPTRLVMRKAKPGESFFATICTSAEPTKKYPVTEVSALSSMILKMTQSLAPDANQFSTESIIIDLVSADACDLTVVDLPGIIRTVTAGQSVQMIDHVNRLIKAYLEDQRTIILAVIPANQDIATVDILERAQGVDPTGERTVGVLTKTDLIGPGGEEEVLAVVNNVRKPLALGYVMLKNRSQKDIVENVTTTEAREKELLFFTTHPVFRSLEQKQYGVDQLSKKLTALLVTRIQRGMAPMKALVERELGVARMTLRSLSTFSVPRTSTERQKLLVTIMQEYLRHLNDAVRGEYRDRILVRNAELRMYTIVLKRFEDFRFAVEETQPKFRSEVFIRGLAVQIDQLRGRELPGFLSSQAFYLCMSQYIDLWIRPMQSMLSDVRSNVQVVAAKLSDVLLHQYPAFRDCLRTVAARILGDAVDRTAKQLSDALSREKDPFTLNDFLQEGVNKLRFQRFSDAVDHCFESTKSSPENWDALKGEVYGNMRQWYRETHSVSAQSNAQDMSAILESYWQLSSKRFVDMCCMLVDKELLGKLPSAMQEQMYKFVRDDEQLKIFYAEDPAAAHRRELAEQRRDQLMKASTVLAGIPAHYQLDASQSVPQQQTVAPNGHSSSEVHSSSSSSSSAAAAAVLTPQKGTSSGVVDDEDSSGLWKSVASPSPPPNAKLVNVDGERMYRLSLTINIGTNGMGIVVSEADPKYMVVANFRAMPDGLVNPSVEAGMKIGDRVEQVNGKPAATRAAAFDMLKGLRGPVNLTILRKE